MEPLSAVMERLPFFGEHLISTHDADGIDMAVLTEDARATSPSAFDSMFLAIVSFIGVVKQLESFIQHFVVLEV